MGCSHPGLDGVPWRDLLQDLKGSWLDVFAKQRKPKSSRRRKSATPRAPELDYAQVNLKTSWDEKSITNPNAGYCTCVAEDIAEHPATGSTTGRRRVAKLLGVESDKSRSKRFHGFGWLRGAH
jgi:hypothetical protein